MGLDSVKEARALRIERTCQATWGCPRAKPIPTQSPTPGLAKNVAPAEGLLREVTQLECSDAISTFYELKVFSSQLGTMSQQQTVNRAMIWLKTPRSEPPPTSRASEAVSLSTKALPSHPGEAKGSLLPPGK